MLESPSSSRSTPPFLAPSLSARPGIDPALVLDALPDALMLVDEGDVVRYANPACAELVGWPLEELVGGVLLRLVPERLRRRHLDGFARYVADPCPERLRNAPPVTVPLLRADDTEVLIDLRLRGLVLPDEDGRTGRVLVLGTLTRKKVRLPRQGLPRGLP